MPRIKDLIASQSLGVAGRAVKSIANTVRGVINNRTDSGVATSPFKTEQLTYPADLGTEGSEQGHYIIFTVREFSSDPSVSGTSKKDAQIATAKLGELAAGKVQPGYRPGFAGLEGALIDKGKSFVENNQIEGLTPTVIKNVYEAKSQFGPQNVPSDIKNRDFLGAGTLEESEKNRVRIRAGTQRSSTFITLYMPPQIKNITGAQYKDQEISAVITTGGSALTDQLEQGQLEKLALIVGRDKLVQLGGGALSMFGAEGLRDALTLASGRLISNRMELVFDGVTKRQFTYTFNFYPKSEEEAQEVDKIVRTFRANMLPTRNGNINNILDLGVPNEFNIDYMYKGQQNSFMNKIGNCVLSDMDVTYGGDKFAGFRLSQNEFGNGSPPTETTVTLTFREIDILTRELVAEGF